MPKSGSLRACKMTTGTVSVNILVFIYLFGLEVAFNHCIGHNTMGCFMGRGNQYI